MPLFGWVFVVIGTASGVWGITDTLAGSPLTGFSGVVGMIVAYAAAMIQGD